jgi:uncharacterized repeat protein (TIGR03837 family)
MRWDLFCRVIDNLGDIGVCWRLAADLASRGNTVHLWIDDASALAWMAPQVAAGVEVHGWPAIGSYTAGGDVVIEAFGCELPLRVRQAMASQSRPPVWINLEYLSAEDYVERSHRLPSPQADGLQKWFFFPGFTAATGGLIREPSLMLRREAFDADAWLVAQGWPRRPDERVVSLFCYDSADVAGLVDCLCTMPTLLLTAPGPAAKQVSALLGPDLRRGELRAVLLPWLTQTDFDRLLWTSDLNFVRGEDSFVRAQWAGRPFVWQPYPQVDGAHVVKLRAFLTRHLAHASPALSETVRNWFMAWNDASQPWPPLPDLSAWTQHTLQWRETLLRQADLATQLIAFAQEKR